VDYVFLVRTKKDGVVELHVFTNSVGPDTWFWRRTGTAANGTPWAGGEGWWECEG
jgi:hypothetical protein